MELVSIKDIDEEEKVLLLKELGYETDKKHIFKDEIEVRDIYTDEPVEFDNMIIMPGSTIILNNDIFSIANYFEEYGDLFGA